MRDETGNARSCCVIMQVGALDETNHGQNETAIAERVGRAGGEVVKQVDEKSYMTARRR